MRVNLGKLGKSDSQKLICSNERTDTFLIQDHRHAIFKGGYREREIGTHSDLSLMEMF